MNDAGSGTPSIPAVPRATLRLQLGAGLTFEDVRELVPYFADLGISHLYLSPVLKARSGSTHGYDVVDHSRFHPEIGDDGSFSALVEAAQARGMGLILDFAPNHMGVGGADNPWWLSVLEWGTASPYASFFDIDWQPAAHRLRNKVLLPFLGDHYGRILEAGELKLAFDPGRGSFSVWYHEHRFPIAVRDYARILRQADSRLSEANEDLKALISSFSRVSARPRSVRRQASLRQEADALKSELATLAARAPEVGKAIDDTARELNGTPGEPGSFRGLHALLERQAYQLAYWRVASDEINYRRFFDINDLAGLRVELDEPFELSHLLIFRLIGEGKLQGLRLDHIDGLHDPEAYLRRLQDRATRLAMQARGGEAGERPFLVLVEKILAQHERLRDSWPVAGTTGYEFLNLVNGLFVDPGAEHAMSATYRRFAERSESFEEIVRSAKRQVLQENLASEVHVIAAALYRLAQQSWRTRDYTLNALRAALVEIIVYFPVYRTYVSARGVDQSDRHFLDWAVGRARKATTGETGVFDFLHRVFTTDLRSERREGYKTNEIVRTAMKFQQLTSPVMAKAFEDTALYRYNRLLSLNDVGGEPDHFATSPTAFHHVNRERLQRHPASLVTTATHDMKRGEDVRARLSVLTEMPNDWRRRVLRWSRLNRGKRGTVDEKPAPGRNREYFIYQTLVGTWPPALSGSDGEALKGYTDRISGYLTKVVREAKERTSWTMPDSEYEAAVDRFVRAVLDPVRARAFLEDFVPFQSRIARTGAVNSLTQTLLRITVPGVPDTYQGGEFWDLSLVDPDNRRQVNYAARREALRALSDGSVDPETLLATWRDGHIKLYVLWQGLRLRSRLPGVFAEGEYIPLEANGPSAASVIAFLRSGGEGSILVVVPRLAFHLLSDDDAPRFREGAWTDTRLTLPGLEPGTTFSSALGDGSVAIGSDGTLEVGPLLSPLPVGLWRSH